MLTHRCAFCANQTHFTNRVGRVDEADSPTYRISVAATCDACGKFNVATGILESSSWHTVGEIMPSSTLDQIAKDMTYITWMPPSMVQADTEYLPEDIGGYFQEAHDAFSIGAFRAVLLLSRSVIEATAKANDVGGNNLVGKIDALHQEGLIRPGTKAVAHALRVLGNDTAHGDLGTPPTKEDAEDVLKLLRMVLDDVYVGEAMTADILKRRGKTAD